MKVTDPVCGMTVEDNNAAAGVLFPFFGILLSPILAAGAIGMSSVTVVSNALRLRRFKAAF